MSLSDIINNTSGIPIDYITDINEIDMQIVKNAINKCFDYFTNNKGDTKPNAANTEGIPYHLYSDSWQWHPSLYKTNVVVF